MSVPKIGIIPDEKELALYIRMVPLLTLSLYTMFSEEKKQLISHLPLKMRTLRALGKMNGVYQVEFGWI